MFLSWPCKKFTEYVEDLDLTLKAHLSYYSYMCVHVYINVIPHTLTLKWMKLANFK